MKLWIINSLDLTLPENKTTDQVNAILFPVILDTWSNKVCCTYRLGIGDHIPNFSLIGPKVWQRKKTHTHNTYTWLILLLFVIIVLLLVEPGKSKRKNVRLSKQEVDNDNEFTVTSNHALEATSIHLEVRISLF